MILTRSKSFSNNGVSSFAHNENSALRISHDDRHSLAIRIEFYNVKQFVLYLFARPCQVDYYVIVDISVVEGET